MALKLVLFVILSASGLEFLCGLVPQWLRRRYRLLFRLRVGAHFPLELPLGGSWDVTGKLLGTSGLPRECLGVLRGRLGEAFGSFGGVLGGFWELLEPLETPLGASGASQGGSWVLPEHLREALGSSRDALGSILGCFWDVSGSLLGLQESVVNGKDTTVKIHVFPKEFIGF